MALRSQQDLKTHICVYKLKDFEKTVISDPAAPKTQTTKIKKLIPKLDEKGNIVYKTVIIQVKSGCGCKANLQTVRNEEKKVPEMVEVEVDTPVKTALNITPSEGNYVICKLYGTVKSTLCENCKTYKSK